MPLSELALVWVGAGTVTVTASLLLSVAWASELPVVEDSDESVEVAVASQASLKFSQKVAKVLATVRDVSDHNDLQMTECEDEHTRVNGVGLAGDGPVGASAGILVELIGPGERTTRAAAAIVAKSALGSPPRLDCCGYESSTGVMINLPVASSLLAEGELGKAVDLPAARGVHAENVIAS